MNTAEINNLLAERLGKTQRSTRELLDEVVGVLSDAMVREETFTVPGLGTFGIKERKAHKAFNPALKKIVTLPSTKAPYFHSATGLKRQVKEEVEE